MKFLELILVLFLSLSCGDRKGVVPLLAETVQESAALSVSPACTGRSSVADGLMADIPGCLDRLFCLSSAQAPVFAGENQNAPVSVRSVRTSGVNRLPARSANWILKSGKSLCVRHFEQFLSAEFLSESGRMASGRYLFSICRLRL